MDHRQCAEEGKKWYNKMKDCSKINNQFLESFHGTFYQKSCEIVFKLACLNEINDDPCINGIKAAKEEQHCNHNESNVFKVNNCFI